MTHYEFEKLIEKTLETLNHRYTCKDSRPSAMPGIRNILLEAFLPLFVAQKQHPDQMTFKGVPLVDNTGNPLWEGKTNATRPETSDPAGSQAGFAAANGPTSRSR